MSDSTTARGEGEPGWDAWTRDGQLTIPTDPDHDPGGKHDAEWRHKGWEPIKVVPAAPAQRRIEELEGALEFLTIRTAALASGQRVRDLDEVLAQARSALSPQGES